VGGVGRPVRMRICQPSVKNREQNRTDEIRILPFQTHIQSILHY